MPWLEVRQGELPLLVTRVPEWREIILRGDISVIHVEYEVSHESLCMSLFNVVLEERGQCHGLRVLGGPFVLLPEFDNKGCRRLL